MGKIFFVVDIFLGAEKMLAKKKSGEEKNWMNIFFGQKKFMDKKNLCKKISRWSVAGDMW